MRLIVFPRWGIEPVGGEVVVGIGSQHEARPIDHWLCHNSRSKAVGIANNPCGQDTTTGATGDKQLIGIDIALGDQGINARDQVVVVVAGVGEVNLVGECLAVTRAAARVGVEHHVPSRCVQLHLGAVIGAVGGVRTTMNLEDHGVLLLRVKAWGFYYPAFDRLTIVR